MNTVIQNLRFDMRRIEKAFSGIKVLHDVSLQVSAGEVLGLVGENGSGKSTTMNVAAGVHSADAGLMFLDGEPYAPTGRRVSQSAGVAFIQQELNVFSNLTVSENLFLCRSPRWMEPLPVISKAKRRAQAIGLLRLVGLEVDPDAPAAELSIGELQLLEIAAALADEARVVIFDEPTTSLTARETERLFTLIARLTAKGMAIIYISHVLEDVMRLANRIAVMRDGRVVARAATIDTSIRELVVAMVGRPIGTLFPPRRPSVNPKPILEVRELTRPGVLQRITFCVGRGEIVGLSGLMGAGRTELARALFGLDSHSEGTISIDGHLLYSGDVRSRVKAGIAFLTEDRRAEGLMMDASVADNLALAALPEFSALAGVLVRQSKLDRALREIAAKLQIKGGSSWTTAIQLLSGGNQQKALLGRWLLRKSRLFILDEPTRGVDIGARTEIYRLLVELADEGMAILVISSELEELIGLCDRILTMRRGELQTEFTRERFDRNALLAAVFGQEVDG